MPQFDSALFAPQLVWLAIVFVALLLVMWRVALPKVGGVVLMREERIQGNLQKAEGLKAEAEAALASYQKLIADAKTSAQAEHNKAVAAIVAETANREATFSKRLDSEDASAEARITAAKNEALSSVRTIAADLASAMAGKLIGVNVGGDAAATAVGAAMKERG
jgi:F-type H+-transporting ATPase subunit b